MLALLVLRGVNAVCDLSSLVLSSIDKLNIPRLCSPTAQIPQSIGYEGKVEVVTRQLSE